MKKSSVICLSVLAIIGLILIIVSMAGFAYFPPLIESQVFKNIDLADKDTEEYKNFVSRSMKWYYDTLCFPTSVYLNYKFI